MRWKRNRFAGQAWGARRVVRCALVVLLLGAASCGTNLSTMTPAETTPAGHVRFSAGTGVSIPVSTLQTIIDQGEVLVDAAASGEALTEEQEDDVFRASVATLLALPSFNPEIQGRYGIVDRLDVGLRIGSGSIRADGRYEIWPAVEPGATAVSVGLGIGYYALGLSIPGILESVVDFDDFTRFELDVPLLVGWSTDVWRVWMGPKLVFTSYGIGIALNAPSVDVSAEASGMQVFLAGQAGAAVGFRYVWVALELTVAYGLGSAELDVLGERVVDLSTNGVVIYPAVALIVQI